MPDDKNYARDKVLSILRSTEEINHLNDVDAILDRILFESRKLTRADAGSIFLVNNESLSFSYVHNDTLFREDENNAALYDSFSVPINEKSIVGYAARTGKILKIDNAYSIPDTLPYSFNPAFDQETGYRTTSILTIPLKTFENRLVGVMQLINAKDEKSHPVPFTEDDETYVPLLADNASVAIERGIMNRELILRMLKMAELRDPAETGAHVQRVGAYSAEIYQRWAVNHGLGRAEIKKNRDLIRLAAMLHDVGKVGISDFILKKPAKLDDQEFATMQWHTVFGARLFVNTTSELDRMSADIALMHHEKWDGTGYPGSVKDIFSETVHMGAPKKGTEIPLAARITGLADVFDALSSRRSYKPPWTDEKILSTIEEGAGTHFDPEVYTAFTEIFDVIKAIQGKFQG